MLADAAARAATERQVSRLVGRPGGPALGPEAVRRRKQSRIALDERDRDHRDSPGRKVVTTQAHRRGEAPQRPDRGRSQAKRLAYGRLGERTAWVSRESLGVLGLARKPAKQPRERRRWRLLRRHQDDGQLLGELLRRISVATRQRRSDGVRGFLAIS